MKRHAVFTVTLEFDESTFGIEDPDQEQDDMRDMILPDVAVALGKEARRLLEFHADGVVLADMRAELSKPFDETPEPF
jgi:hypothetical protein